MDVEAARTAAALLAAVGIWIGIAAMVGVNVVRGRQQAEAAERAEAAARNERREAREAREAARREADQRHVENMAAIDAQNRRLDTQSAALAEAVAALRVVVERTPAPGAAQ